MATVTFDGNNAPLRRKIQESKSELTGFSASAQKVLGSAFNVGGLASLAALTTGVIGLGKAFNAASSFEGLVNGLNAVSSGAESTSAQLVALEEAAKAPGLGFREAILGSIRLQAIGVTAEKSRALLKNFGNAIATVGGGKAELDRVTLALGQIGAKGKVTAQDINQINEVVPQIRQALKDAFGTADTEQLQAMGITAEDFFTKINEQFSKLPRVVGGSKIALENLGDSFDRLLIAVGTPISNALAPLIEDLSGMFEEALEGGKEFGAIVGQIGQQSQAAIAIARAAIAEGKLDELLATALKLGLGVAANYGVGVFATIAQALVASVKTLANKDVWIAIAAQAVNIFAKLPKTAGYVLAGIGDTIRAELGSGFNYVVSLFQAGLATVIDKAIGLLQDAGLGLFSDYIDNYQPQSFKANLKEAEDRNKADALRESAKKNFELAGKAAIEGFEGASEAVNLQLEAMGEEFKNVKFTPGDVVDTESLKTKLADLSKSLDPEAFKKLTQAIDLTSNSAGNLKKQVSQTNQAAVSAKPAVDTAKEKDQEIARQKYADEFKVLLLQANGHERAANALKKQIEQQSQIKKLVEDTGISQANAKKLVEQRTDLEEKAQRAANREAGIRNRTQGYKQPKEAADPFKNLNSLEQAQEELKLKEKLFKIDGDRKGRFAKDGNSFTDDKGNILPSPQQNNLVLADASLVQAIARVEAKLNFA